MYADLFRGRVKTLACNSSKRVSDSKVAKTSKHTWVYIQKKVIGDNFKQLYQLFWIVQRPNYCNEFKTEEMEKKLFADDAVTL